MSELEHLKTGEKSTRFGEFQYAAGTWRKDRRVIAKAEHSSMGRNLRCVVTNLEGEPEDLYKNEALAKPRNAAPKGLRRVGFCKSLC